MVMFSTVILPPRRPLGQYSETDQSAHQRKIRTPHGALGVSLIVNLRIPSRKQKTRSLEKLMKDDSVAPMDTHRY